MVVESTIVRVKGEKRMGIEKSRELLTRIRGCLNLPNNILITDDELWSRTKNTLFTARIYLAIGLRNLGKDIKETFFGWRDK